ncbi:hypothetical protein APR04_005667 [Promicromonospora umidemergens]|uniref:DUF5134 domain-containing protein n=2 Tax=Promicromonospora umidemergens TaxID=629679 RepID=A0ABP8YBZ6_9MICO|nr:hypothetical protein [Promicromonospora umidemergens]
MTSDAAVQWAMTTLFGLLSAHSLWCLATARRIFSAVGYLLHLGMNAIMVAMVWPWWAYLPTLPQLALFVLAAAFFAAVAGWRAADARPRGLASSVPRTGHHESAWAQAVHAVMMLAMVWAVAIMSLALASPAAALGPVGHQGPHAVAHAPTGLWAMVSGVLLVVTLVAGGISFLFALSRHVRVRGFVCDRVGSDLLAGAAMSLGMAAMCATMLAG